MASVLYRFMSAHPYKLALHTWYVEAKAVGYSISRLNGRVNGLPNVFGQRPTSRAFHPAIGSVSVSHSDLDQSARSRPFRAIALPDTLGNGFGENSVRAHARKSCPG